MSTTKRGFAKMRTEDVQKIARLGGLAVSADSQHMATIGRKGGLANGMKKSVKS